MKYLKITKILIATVALSIGGLLSPQIASACGGQTASMGNVGDRLVAWTHADGNPRAMDYKANVQPAEVFVPPALADAIAEKYVSTYYPNADDVHFHAFLFEHGSYVYMYDITDSSIRNRSTITACGSNPQKSESNAMDIHIDAITGDVWDGQGCGGGPSKIVMKYNASDYPAGLTTQTKNLVQFHSEFVIPIDGETATTDHDDDHSPADNHDAQKDKSMVIESQPITIDGRIDEQEWSNAASMRLEQYGKTIDIKSKISEGKLYWAIEADTKNWLAFLLKASPHHGMVWEFTDAKMLSKNGVEDYHVVYKGMMVGAGLEKDRSNSIIAQATGETDNGRIYEFSMPLQGGSEDVSFQIGEYGNMAFYFGSSETFSGQLVYEDAFSKHMMMQIGKEIHRSVVSSIIPETIVTAYANSDGKTKSSGSSNQNVNLALLIIAIGGVIIVAFRKRLKKMIK